MTLALAAGVPIAAVFVLLVVLRWPAARAMALGWLLASALALLVWRIEATWWAAASVYGALQALEIVLIVFGAILLMNHLEASGAIGAIRRHFSRISGDRRVQVLLIGLGFETLIEGAAGFGTPGALAAPLLFGLGFPPLAAAVMALVFNAPTPPFGAAGTPVIGGIGAVIDERVLGEGIALPAFLEQVTEWTSLVTGAALVFWGLLGVFLLIYWFGREEERTLRGALRVTLPVAPFALLLGVLAGGTQLAMAWLFGPELPNIAAGFVVLGAGVALARRGVLVPGAAWDFPDTGEKKSNARETESGRPMPVLLAWTPYLLVALVLIVTRWPDLGIGAWLRAQTLDVRGILGEELSFSLRYLYSPGVLPFIPVALLTALLHRMDARSVAAAWRRSARQIAFPALTLVVAVAMTQVMIQSAANPLEAPGMIQALSQVLARAAGEALPLAAPWIGALGAFMTGSNTSSNVLFSVLQHDAAAEIGVPRTLAVALQNVGGGLGNMIAVLNVAAICGVLRMAGMEGAILRKTLVATVIFALFAGLAGMLLAALLGGVY